MARRITLTRDERIVLAAAIEDGGHIRRLPHKVPVIDLGRITTKLEHRGLIDCMGHITDDGHRAYSEARKTQPKPKEATL